MAKEFKNLNELFKFVEKQVQSTLRDEVAKVAVETMQKHVQEDVYDVYEPVMYERTGRLKREIEVDVVDDNTIAIENARYENGRNIAEIVETGQGYQYYFEFYGEERPFTRNTREELKNTNKLKNAMAKGLNKRGIKT